MRKLSLFLLLRQAKISKFLQFTRASSPLLFGTSWTELALQRFRCSSDCKNRTCFSCFQIVSQLITTELNETLLTCSVMVFSSI